MGEALKQKYVSFREGQRVLMRRPHAQALLVTLALGASAPALAQAPAEAPAPTARDAERAPAAAAPSKTPDAPTKTAAPHRRCPETIAPEDGQDPLRLTMLGVRCFQAGRYGRALVLYRQAARQRPSPLLDGATGRALDELGVWGPARAYYQRYLDTSQDAEGKRRVRERLDALSPRILKHSGQVTIVTPHSGATVHLLIDDHRRAPLGQTPYRARLAPGRYTMALEHPGYFSERFSVRVREGGAVTVDRAMVPLNATFNVTARGWRRAGVVTLVAGAQVVVAGAILNKMGSDRIDDANANGWEDPAARADTRRSGRNLRDWGTGLLLTGSAAVLTGGILTLVGVVADGPPS